MYGRLFLYLAMVVIGIWIGSRKQSEKISNKLIQNVQVVALIVLLFTMGIKIGADDRVFQSLKMIGLSAGVITVLSLIFSVLAVFLVRKALGINMQGRRKMTRVIMLSVAIGIATGYFFVPENLLNYTGYIIDIGLCLMLFLSGWI